MAVEIVTREDLEAFQVQLLHDLEALVKGGREREEKRWLKNEEVRKLLQISASTVQWLRVMGKLKSSKVGGTHYYRVEDVQQLLQSGLKTAS